MPSQELKRIFNAGKMNRDLDDRLVPSGEYREALNINIGRSEGSDVGAVENLIGNLEKSNSAIPTGAKVIGSFRDNTRERIYFFVTTNTTASGRVGDPGEFVHQVWEFQQITESFHKLVEYDQRPATIGQSAVPTTDWMNLWSGALITGVNLLENLLFWTDNRNEPRRIDIDRARSNERFYDSDFRTGVIKKAPIVAPTIQGTLLEGDSNVTESTFLSDKLPRFAYRYQFEDGEYSVISPFTQIVFNPETAAQRDGAGLTLSRASLDSAAVSGDFSELDNKVREVTLRVPNQADIDFLTTTVEFLYKDTSSNTVYIIGEGAPNTDRPDGLEFTYRSQDPFRALPASQLTRVYDAVPRLAQSQEIAGGRIVYGNYLQNYDIPDNFDFSVSHVADSTTKNSVKRRRTYQVGVVLADRFGRLSPVILSSTGRDSIFIPADTAQGSQRLSINFSIEGAEGTRTIFPDWADSYRIVVKQREQEYYNVIFNGQTMTANQFARSGDNINKLPIDQTQAVETGAATRPSSEKVYANFNGSAQLSDPVLYTPQGIDQTGNITIPTTQTFGANTVAFETEPVISNLDIFFETSTGGAVADIPDNNIVNIDFSNCYIQDANSAASGTAVPFRLEINRLRAGFNEPAFDVGVRAHLVQENFSGEERRGNTLIHSSGLFNTRTNTNQLNQFNESEGGLTINLDPSDGTIQKLFAEDTQLIIWQEDKVSRSPIDKDFIYSAEGGQVPVTSNTQYLGTIAPYSGEYGISRDPASFAVYGTRKYFTDKNRGVVLRLSNDGLTEISGAGMNDFFRDALRNSRVIIGSFDEYHDVYNLTIRGDGYAANPDTNIGPVRENIQYNAEQALLPVGERDASYPREFDYFTVSFEEDVQGWNSFKSFRQESGLTLNNTYYTFSGGNLWEHGAGTLRNNFYGVQYDSLLELIFNDSSSVVKDFKTLVTEGSAGWDCTRLITDIEEFGQDVDRVVTGNLELDPVAASGFGGNTIIPEGRSLMVTDQVPQQFVITLTPFAGYDFTNANQIQLSIGDDDAAQYFTIASFDSEGERTNEGATEQAIVGRDIVSVVIFNPPPSLLDAEGNMLNTRYDLIVSGTGPRRTVAGDQYTITLSDSIEGFQDFAWEGLSNTRIGNVVRIDTRWYAGGNITQYATYGVQGKRTFNTDGSLNILEDVRYFPSNTDGTVDAAYVTTGDSPGIQIGGNAGSQTVDIVYPASLIGNIQTDTGNEVLIVPGTDSSIPSTFVFDNGQPKTRNDIFVSQKFDIPEVRQSYTLNASGDNNIPRYNRVNVTLNSEAATSTLLRGPISTDGVEFFRRISVAGTPFGTGTDIYDDAVTGTGGAGAQIPTSTTVPQEIPGGPLATASGASIDQRGTSGTVQISVRNTNHETFIPVPTTAGNLLLDGLLLMTM